MTTKDFIKSHILHQGFKDIVEICKPLRAIGIQGFFYMRRYPDGSFIDLSNQLEWSTYFLNQFFELRYSAESMQNQCFFDKNVTLWAMNKNHAPWQEAEQIFGYGNGITISVPHKHFDELFCFYGKATHTWLNDFYITHFDLLKSFCDYFRDKAEPIIKLGKSSPLYTPAHYLGPAHNPPVFKEKVEEFIQKIGINPYQEPLSEQELRCIRGCAQGKTAQKIADQLFISKRTVEGHLNRAKAKLNCTNISELVYRASKYFNI